MANRVPRLTNRLRGGRVGVWVGNRVGKGGFGDLLRVGGGRGRIGSERDRMVYKRERERERD